MKEGEEGGGSRGAAMGGELQGVGHGGAAGLPRRASCSREGCCVWFSVVRDRGRKQEQGEEKKEEKERKKIWKIFQTWKFLKNKK
jgi:hypothetical protein